MRKFDINKLKDESTVKENIEAATPLSVGVGLLNSSSQTQKTTIYVRIEDIEPNKKNQMSLNNISELADLIDSAGGLEQPLVVYQIKETGKYRILTGERRYWAIKMLINQNKWNEDHLVEVKVKDLDAVNLPLDTDSKELFSILVTNQNRIYTDADRYFEAVSWKKIIQELRKGGKSLKVVGYDEEGNPIKREIIKIGEDSEGKAIEKDITGMKTQQVVADNIGISHAQVGKIEKIQNKGADVLIDALKKDKVNIAVGSKIADMPKEKQVKIVTDLLNEKKEQEVITQEDIRKKVLEETHPDIKEVSNPESSGTLITEDSLKNDLKDIFVQLKASEGTRLSDVEYGTYKIQLKVLKKLLSKK